MPFATRLIAALALSLTLATGVPAQEETPTETQPALGQAVEDGGTGPLRVATRTAPPFAFVGPDGEWTGIAIELFRAVADELDRSFTLEEVPLDDMIDGTAAGTYDAAIAALSITPGREERVDFSFPFYSTGLGIAVHPDPAGGWLRVVRNIFTWQFLAVLAGLSTVLVAAGGAVWAFERRGNNEEFHPDALHGIGDGFWWAAVTMTTVGYGDKAPRTLGGRIVGLIWMFTAMLIVASFTAAIAASLTVGQLSQGISGIADLEDASVGVVSAATGADEMAARGIRARGFDTIEDGYDALAAGRIDAFLHDMPLLRWIALQEYQGEIQVLPDPIGRQDYGIALPEGDELREPINRALLAYIRSPEWQALVTRYLGGM
ncbi:transporter substrate-binding domain-containing protein [Tranquillimonas rosea]|uniref:transporter substrate-binding domain-containing protein n=1 Tax=Tranquillimonas rosea TaxID=641238 RepID=UPI003BAA0001